MQEKPTRKDQQANQGGYVRNPQYDGVPLELNGASHLAAGVGATHDELAAPSIPDVIVRSTP